MSGSIFLWVFLKGVWGAELRHPQPLLQSCFVFPHNLNFPPHPASSSPILHLISPQTLFLSPCSQPPSVIFTCFTSKTSCLILDLYLSYQVLFCHQLRKQMPGCKKAAGLNVRNWCLWLEAPSKGCRDSGKPLALMFSSIIYLWQLTHTSKSSSLQGQSNYSF